MGTEIWVGMVEVRQLPVADPKIALKNKGAFTWVASWATDAENYESKVDEVMRYYGLFVVAAEQVMPYDKAEGQGFGSQELAELVERTKQDESFCIFGTLHSYRYDN